MQGPHICVFTCKNFVSGHHSNEALLCQCVTNSHIFNMFTCVCQLKKGRNSLHGEPPAPHVLPLKREIVLVSFSEECKNYPNIWQLFS